MGLDRIRAKIDRIDRKIVQLVAKRISLVSDIGEYKRKNNLPTCDPKREKELLAEKKKIASELNVNPDLVEDIFKRLIKESCSIEEMIIKRKKD